MRLNWRDLSKRLGGKTIFSQLTGTVEPGELLVVTGANGSGKTTLLRLLAGLSRPTRGRVVWEHEGEHDVAECANEIGFVTPELALYGELTALENLEFFSRARGLRHSGDDLCRRIDAVGLGGREHDCPAEFSSGMNQRLKLAFATLHDPTVLLLDEPGSNLDDAGADVVRQIIAAQRQRGVCVLATNDERERSYGDRLLEL